MFSMFVALQEGAPLWKQILSDIPHDAPAILIYTLIAGSAFLIWRANRKES